MESPLVIGATVAAAAWSGKFLIGAWQAFKARPVVPRVKRFYNGGFEQEMTRREAALILGVRESAVIDKIKEAHRRVMVANHPDAGGSHYLASKINEAKQLMVGKTKGLLRELGFPQHTLTPLHVDNTSAIHIATNFVFHEPTKHIEVDCHYIREALDHNVLTLPHIFPEHQTADVFTKALPRPRHQLMIDKLMLLDRSASI